MTMKIKILGSGTSTGVPVIGCDCEVCKSNNPKDNRLRSSLLIESEGKNIIIDTGPDFRLQMLRENIKNIDAVLLTHGHYDHIGGFDDLRPLCFFNAKQIPVYTNNDTTNKLKTNYPYIFGDLIQEGGGVANVKVIEISNQLFSVFGIDVKPIPIKHGILDIFGFRIGNFAYITDASEIPNDSYKLLNNLDILILNALRPKIHPTHFNFEQAIEEAQKIGAKKTYFIHLSHNMLHSEIEKKLPKNIYVTYDGLSIDT